jgi:hypothetical protein
MTDSSTALVPVVASPDLPALHAQALPTVVAAHEHALARAQETLAQTERAVASAQRGVSAAEEASVIEFNAALDRAITPTAVTADGEPCCTCGTPLSRPGYCSKECGDQAALHLPNAQRLSGPATVALYGDSGGAVVARPDAALVERAQDDLARCHRAFLAAGRQTALLDAAVALLRQGLPRAALRDAVPAAEGAFYAAAKHRRALWKAAEQTADARYVILREEWQYDEVCPTPCQHDLCDRRRATKDLVRSVAGDAYRDAQAAQDSAERAWAAASAVWGAVLRTERDLRGVPPRPRLCLYCELVPIEEEGRLYCGKGCERKAEQDGLETPLPGIKLCEACSRTFRNPAAPECPYCSLSCLLSQPVDIEPWLTVDFSAVVFVAVPKSAAERRRLGRQLKKLEAEHRAQAGRGAPAGRVLPQTTKTGEEAAEEAILARLQGAAEPILEPALVKGAGAHVDVARAVLRRLVAAGRVVRLGTGRRGDPYRFQLPGRPE